MKPAVFPELAAEYAAMLAELENAPLLVVLSPAPDPRHEDHMVRVCASTPPRWYRRLCEDFPSLRGTRRGKFDTKIKRRGILRALFRMAEGDGSRSTYAPNLLRIAVSRLRSAARRSA